MWLLTLRDLQYRGVRVALVIVGTTVVFALLFLMSGLTEQFVYEPRALVSSVGAESWVLPRGASGPFTSGAAFDSRLARRAGADGSPLITTRYAVRGSTGTLDVVLLGFDPGGIGRPPVAEGRPPRAGQVMLDRSAGIAVGEVVRMGPRRFRVSGLTEGLTLFAGMPVVVMRIGDAQDLAFKGRPVASAFITDVDAARAREALPGAVSVLDNEDVVADALRPLKNAVTSVNVVRILLWMVSAMIIGGVVYLSALERRRDFAVLKAVGGSTRGLLAGLAVQGALIALVASLLASGLQRLLDPVFPISVRVTPAVLIQVPLVALVIAVLASIGGMRQVARTDPAAAFAGPGV